MAIQLTEKNGGKALEVQVSGKLVHEDYKHFVPEFRVAGKAARQDSVLFEMADFHGWEAGALWDDIKFARTIFRTSRTCDGGRQTVGEGHEVFCKPFTTAKVRYFDCPHRPGAGVAGSELSYTALTAREDSW